MEPPDIDNVHVFPVDDVIGHEVDGEDCPCLPEIEPIVLEDGSIRYVYIHHAWDGRD